MTRHERVALEGPAGTIELWVDAIEAEQAVSGIAIVAHPHPLFGGSASNKVVTTIARALGELGYVALRPNFRGVGASTGMHDHGTGETDDLLRVLDYATERFGSLPVVLAGFSFGAHVVVRMAGRLADTARPVHRLVLVGTAAGAVEGMRSYATEKVPENTVVIHGDIDETVPLANVLQWAEPQDLPVILVPGASHFFHRKLHVIRKIIHSAWCR
jgi:alpha/beta superfamily hydrolase